MRFILHREINSKCSPDSYNIGKEMLYFLGNKLHLSGISKFYYLNVDNHKTPINFNQKIQSLISWAQGEEKQSFENVQRAVKNFNKMKNKDPKLIVATNQMKRAVDKLFEAQIEEHIEKMDEMFGVVNFSGLIEKNRIDFYHVHPLEKEIQTIPITKLVDILTLQLPEEEGEHPVLFLCNENESLESIIDLETNPIEDKNAKDLKKGYLVELFHFYAISSIPETVLRAIALEFSTKAAPMIQHLNEWAKECYENPNTTKGLEYFSTEIAPLIEQYKNTALELDNVRAIKNATGTDKKATLLFGELPITKIWELLFKTTDCTEEDYQQLLKIKEEQAPKFDGRWPVVFYRVHSEIFNELLNDLDEVPQKRKTLDID